MSDFWPGTDLPKSTGNGFDLRNRIARGRSIFYTPTRTAAEAGKLGGLKSASLVPTVAGLSERAQAQLNHAPKTISLGKRSDTEKRGRARKASI